MMKTYKLYVFTQDDCGPCIRLKKHVATLPESEQAELDFVPLRTRENYRTALAEEHNIELTPTLLVVHEELSCSIDDDGEEDCDGIEVSVERFVGANSIIEHLPCLLYTSPSPRD